MRLLIVTQAVDSTDPVLGFFVRWIEELAKRFDTVTVIALTVGTYSLPSNVSVYSLGKEQGRRHPFAYAISFLKHIWRLRKEYDAVFVHMNQEYILLGGWLWRLLGKRLFLWRNHYAGSLFTNIAALFCDTVFCTSTHSYTAKYKKTELMPIGVDETLFYENSSDRIPRSILSLGRIAPSKRLEILIDALALLKKRNVPFIADIYGEPLPGHVPYLLSLKQQVSDAGLSDSVFFHGAVTHDKIGDLYRSHTVFVNCAASGMLDKTIFEAAASGTGVLASSDDFKRLAGEHYYFQTAENLADKLALSLDSSTDNSSLPDVVKSHSLTMLAEKISREMHKHSPRSFRSVLWSFLGFIARFAFFRSPRVSVLMYHSVSDSGNFFSVSPAEFERQMAYAKKHADIISISRLMEHIGGKPLSRDAVVFTFDDGYTDFRDIVIPLIRREKVPAAVFVLAGSADRGELGNDLPILSPEEFNTLANPLVEVGSHGLTHRKITRLPSEAAREELRKSRRTIGEHFSNPRFFAYPKGSHNMSTRALVIEAGYEAAFTAEAHSVGRADDPFEIPRIQIDATTSFSEFKAKLTMAADWYYTVWRLVHPKKRA